MKKILSFAAILLLLTGTFASCGKENNGNIPPELFPDTTWKLPVLGAVELQEGKEATFIYQGEEYRLSIVHVDNQINDCSQITDSEELEKNCLRIELKVKIRDYEIPMTTISRPCAPIRRFTDYSKDCQYLKDTVNKLLEQGPALNELFHLPLFRELFGTWIWGGDTIGIYIAMFDPILAKEAVNTPYRFLFVITQRFLD
jgi:hypothetical protein